MKLSTKQKKLAIIGTVSAVVLLSGGVGYSVVKSNEYKSDLDALKSGVSKENTEVSNLQAKIESAYLKTNKQYLSPTFTKDDFTALEKSVNSLLNDNKKLDNLLSKLKDTDKKAFNSTLSRSTTKLKELSDNFSALKSKFSKQTDLNSLFSKRVLVGDKLSEQPIADSLTKSDFDKVKSSLYVKDTKDAFNKSINDGLTFAEKQLKQIDDTKSKEAELVKNGKATDKANKDSLSQFKSLVEGIKNPNIKKSFDKALKVISDKVAADDKAKEAKAKADAEAKAKADAEAKAKEVGGNVEKQADGTYVVKANDGTEYKATGNGQVTEVPRTQTSSANASNTGGTQSQVSTPSQSTSGSGGSVQTQPSTPAPQPSTPSQPSNPQPTQPSTSTPAPAPQPSAPTIVSGYIGNTGRLWDRYIDAAMWGEATIDSLLDKDGKSHNYTVIGIFYSDGTKKYSVSIDD